jgi:plastocyanin
MNLRYTFLIALLFPWMASFNAQTTHDIEAGGGGSGNPAPYYAPQFITIQQGDIVRWTNSGGTHNVDGTTQTFPANPEGFTNGQPSSSLWMFEHTFDIPGFYEFECAAFDHNETQFGTITVEAIGVGLEEYNQLEIDVFPNPSSDFLNVNLEEAVLEANILSLDMKVISSISVSGFEKQIQIDLDQLTQGSYFIQIRTTSGKAIRRFLKN